MIFMVHWEKRFRHQLW